MFDLIFLSAFQLKLWQVILLGGLWGLATSILVSRTLVKTQRFITHDIKNYLVIKSLAFLKR